MRKFNRVARTLLPAMLMLFLFGLTACKSLPPVVLHDSATIRILPGDLPKSPEFQGYGLGDSSLAKLLEAAEACQAKKAAEQK
jgi:hypothetical protein